MRDELERFVRDMGVDVFGTANAHGVVPNRFARTPYTITLGISLSDAVMTEVKDGPTKLYFHHYRTANAYLDRCALACVMWLQRRGHDALAIPASQTTNTQGIAGDFAHKTAANLAGLGFVGKSGLFITSAFGPRVRFATVLTSLELPSSEAVASACGSCAACVRACPCGAIVGNAWNKGTCRDDIVDAALCSQYMKDKYDMVGRGAVCGICVAVCPIGTDKKSH